MWIKSDHRDSVCEYGGKLGKHFILEVGGEDLNNQIRCFRLHIVEMEEDSMEIIQKRHKTHKKTIIVGFELSSLSSHVVEK